LIFTAFFLLAMPVFAVSSNRSSIVDDRVSAIKFIISSSSSDFGDELIDDESESSDPSQHITDSNDEDEIFTNNLKNKKAEIEKFFVFF